MTKIAWRAKKGPCALQDPDAENLCFSLGKSKNPRREANPLIEINKKREGCEAFPYFYATYRAVWMFIQFSS